MDGKSPIGDRPMKLTVVIGSRNQKTVLEKTLHSLFLQEPPTHPNDSYEIVVVDSSSTDGSAELLAEFQKSHDRLRYFIQDNRGRTGARNRGIREANGEIILFTDADMIADPHLVQEHVDFHRKWSGCAAGRTWNLRSAELSADDPHNWNGSMPGRFRPFSKLSFTEFLTGNLSVRKEDLAGAGLFDESFQGYGWEDMELGYRLQKRGIGLRYLPSAVNFHFHFTKRGDDVARKYLLGKDAALWLSKYPNDTRVRQVLGFQPLAMRLYAWLKKHPTWVSYMEKHYLSGLLSPLWYFCMIQIRYRDGALEAAQKLGVELT